MDSILHTLFTKRWVFMADRLEEKSGGKLTMTIYPSGQLGSEQQCVELLQIGSLAITKVSAAVMESFTENFQVLGLPYVFRSAQHSLMCWMARLAKNFCFQRKI
jgi:TRAP-type C4-dicarboxylate transport system substrate-binding protein